MHKISPKTGQNASRILDFRFINWLPISKREDKCINTITLNFERNF